jgi:fido (protein-threonine AMPylation protein)
MANTSTNREKLIARYFFMNEKGSSRDIHAYLVSNGEDISLVTAKRDIASMKEQGLIIEEGAGPATTYRLTVTGKMMSPINAHEYCSEEPDRRYGQTSYDFELFGNVPSALFSVNELSILDKATGTYLERKHSLSETLHKKELERFIIELSWKSSRIEGNTYTLLDTERLIEKGIEAAGKTRDEAIMILNHKKAFSYIYENIEKLRDLSKTNLEAIHRLLVDGLNVTFNIRAKPVGVTGSKYRPLDNQFQISEAVEQLVKADQRMKTGYDKAFLSILGISYIQPFEDGNKRTSRLMGNAILLSNNLVPLSYRSVDEDAFREAVLVFYELNSVLPFKKIFIEQYRFAAENYAL